MNERIKELAKQAGFDVEETTGGGDVWFDEGWNTELVERFAELIIGECCIAMNPMLRDMINRGKAIELIKQHFGVR